MTTYNTGNPLGSTDPRDLYDNAKNLDELVNSDSKHSHPDRMGVSRKTWHGMESEFNADQADRRAAFDANQAEFNADQADRRAEFYLDQTSREQQFSTFIASGGYQFAGDYAAGIEITQYNQLVRDENGEFWRVSGRVSLPYTTTGEGAPEDDALVPVGDATLRRELAKGLSTGRIAAESTFKESLSGAGLSITERTKGPVVSWIDDDASVRVLTQYKPIFDEKGVRIGIAVPTAKLNLGGRLTKQEVVSLVKDSGWEALSHGDFELNFTNLTLKQTEAELRDSKRKLEEWGLPCQGFVYVQGATGTKEQRKLVRKYYRSAYVTNADGKQESPFRNYLIRRVGFNKQDPSTDLSLQDFKDIIDLAESNNEMVVFVSHASYGDLTPEREQVLRDIIDYIQGKNIPILPPKEALDYSGNLFEVGDPGRKPNLIPALDSPTTIIDRTGKLIRHEDVKFFNAGVYDGNSPLDEFPRNSISVFPTLSGTSGYPEGSVGVCEVTHLYRGNERLGQMVFTESRGDGEPKRFVKTWDRVAQDWGEWSFNLCDKDSIYLSSNDLIDNVIKDTNQRAFRVMSFNSNQASAAGLPFYGVVVHYGGRYDFNNKQILYSGNSNRVAERRYGSGAWTPWRIQPILEIGNVNGISGDLFAISSGVYQRYVYITTTKAVESNLPEGKAGFFVHMDSGFEYGRRQLYYIYNSNNVYQRRYNHATTSWENWERMAGGASGTFTTADSKTVVVTNGIITSIS